MTSCVAYFDVIIAHIYAWLLYVSMDGFNVSEPLFEDGAEYWFVLACLTGRKSKVKIGCRDGDWSRKGRLVGHNLVFLNRLNMRGRMGGKGFKSKGENTDYKVVAQEGIDLLNSRKGSKNGAGKVVRRERQKSGDGGRESRNHQSTCLLGEMIEGG